MKTIFCLTTLLIFLGCSNSDKEGFKFNGRLEVDVLKIAAKTIGEIDSLFVDEGEKVASGQLLAVVDKDRLKIQLQQQQAQLGEINANEKSMKSQVKQIVAQLKLNNDLITKTKDLVENGAATTQKLYELITQNEVYNAQRETIKAGIEALADKRNQVKAAMDLTTLNLQDSRIEAPLDGMILNRYHNLKELVNPGRILFDIANLDKMDATIYVPLYELNRVKLNQTVRVTVDGIENDLQGRVKWIASEAEFTPKTILTEETRTSLVYAVKIRIENEEGRLKIGMPVDVYIEQEN